MVDGELTAATQPTEGRRLSSLNRIALVALAGSLLFALWAVVFDQPFYLRLATEALILGGLAMSVDLLLGFCGLLSLGHALFFGLGAYLGGLLLIHYTGSFWLTCLLVVPFSAAVGLVGGLVALRSSGVYFALITFAMAQVVEKVVFVTNEIGLESPRGAIDVGGSDGFQGVPPVQVDLLVFGIDLTNPLSFFLLALAFVVATYAGLYWLMSTPFGRTLRALRTNERRLPHLGYAPRRFKLAAFVLSSVIAGLFGALYPMLRGGAFPELLTFGMSADAVISVIIGGTGTLIGPLVGTGLLVFMRSVVGSELGEFHVIIVGLLFMVAVIFFPKGIVGYARDFLERRRHREREDDDA